MWGIQLSLDEQTSSNGQKSLGQIGRYRLLRLICEGGMGRVYRAFDEQMGRYVALKQIRPSLLNSERAKRRFLHEASLTASLNHPSIVPVFQISKEGEVDYYTMPFIQGTNLKDSLKAMKQRGEDLHIMACARIFTNICQAVAHAHNAGILHRDLKAENIMLGQNEQVLILDWGLACWKTNAPFLQEEVADFELASVNLRSHQTKLGKIVGTLAYMPPDRLKSPANEQSDIYSLGVLLYLMLTYQLPFHRKTAGDLRSTASDLPPDPRQVAPHRDIPESLVRIIQKVLNPIESARYENAHSLIEDLQTFLEGRSSWYLLKQFNPSERTFWSLQENIFVERWPSEIFPAHQASWALLMVSEATYSGNYRVESTFIMRQDAQGFGLLFNTNEQRDQIQPLSGYLLWISGPGKGGVCLCRDGSSLVDSPHIQTAVDVEHTVRIEKIDNRIYCSFDAVPCISYVSTLPLVGTHIGLLQIEGGAEIKKLNFFAGGLSLKTSCLTVPDNFLAARDCQKALAEYRRIATLFYGHSEGQKARFLAGITLLEMSRDCRTKRRKNSCFQQALDEFQQLRETPSAPLEWLGKALTYRFWHQWEEEANCLELGCLRYPSNPKKRYLREEVISQLFYATGNHRKLAARLVLLLARTLPNDLFRSDTFAQIEQLRQQLNLPPYLIGQDRQIDLKDERELRWQLILEMNYWLWQPQAFLDSCIAFENRENLPLEDIYYSLRLMDISHRQAERWMKNRFNVNDLWAKCGRELQLLYSLGKSKEIEKAKCWMGKIGTEETPGQKILRPLYLHALKAFNDADYSRAEEIFDLIQAEFPLEAKKWPWIEIRGIILLATGNQIALANWLLSQFEFEQLQSENHFLFPLFASSELMKTPVFNFSSWKGAQFAKKMSVKLLAQCISAALESCNGNGKGVWQKAQDLASRAFWAEKMGVYRHLRAIFQGMRKPTQIEKFQFLKQKAYLREKNVRN